MPARALARWRQRGRQLSELAYQRERALGLLDPSGDSASSDLD